MFNVQKFLLRFFLCHLAVSNLCQWLKTIVDEIGNERMSDEEHSQTNHFIVYPTGLFDQINSHFSSNQTAQLGGHLDLWSNGHNLTTDKPIIDYKGRSQKIKKIIIIIF